MEKMTATALAKYLDFQDGAIVWAKRHYNDFDTELTKDEFTGHLDFNRRFAGQRPTWRGSKKGPYVRVTARGKEYIVPFTDAAEALKLTKSQQDLERQQVIALIAAKQARKNVSHIKRRIFFDDDTGRFVHLHKTQENAPRTSPLKIAAYNETYGGRVAKTISEKGVDYVLIGGRPYPLTEVCDALGLQQK